ncbi:oligoribonuclease [Lysinibacillus xylanilyticus]|uniref:Oligoribonuclease n=1 Tax=Lysinibacillus xylanilyticus TaxID=582475 RepID=A0A0K9FAN8_9BACI|nr:oligoribonuclease [Lysinibacillus xylanilyticus]KMY31283.1 oligoribonuclease [Lysinibacillus xylanilyticus]
MYKLLSHNDLDGIGCGILAKLAFQEQVKVKYNSISSLDREIEYFLENNERDTFLFITDLSPNEENEKRLNDYYIATGNVQLLDHHKTAFYLNEYEWGKVLTEDENGYLTSATSLFYQYLVTHGFLEQTNAITEFVELVRQYDTWEWEKNDNQQARRLNTLFFLVSIEEFEEKMLERLKTNEHFYFDEFEKKILTMEEEKIERYIRRKKRELVQTAIGEYFTGVVYAESYHSELGNELGKENVHLDFIAILNMGGKRISFRTIHDHIDVSAIASEFGGGGHQKAAGCSLTDEAYEQYVVQIFHIAPLPEDAKRNRYNLRFSSFGTMYKNLKGEFFLLYSKSDFDWVIEKNKLPLDQIFTSFYEAEWFLKRNYQAWLVKDELFVDYLMEEAKKVRHRE